MKQKNVCKDLLFGVAVGDALGLPFKGVDREKGHFRRNPITDMMGYGTYNQPPGTFSDESSLTFCLAESLVEGLDLNKLAKKFLDWANNGYWTAYGDRFDIVNSVSYSIERLEAGIEPTLAGKNGLPHNDASALMRILPLVVCIKDMPIEERYEKIKQVASLTNRHHYSFITCFFYLEFARLLLTQSDAKEIYKTLQTSFKENLHLWCVESLDLKQFSNILNDDIYSWFYYMNQTKGYIRYTLEVCIACLLHTNSYEEAVLKAVNMDAYSDTTGSVVGGLAGLLYGFDSIPKSWVNQLARKEDIEELARQLGEKYL